jgi:hypothetical protein
VSRIIINAEGMADDIALRYVRLVVGEGKVSAEGKQYCYHTFFKMSEIHVSCDMTSKGTMSFKVWRDKK